MELQLNQVWAKREPFQSIYTHSVLTGMVAQALLDQMAAPGVRAMLAEKLQSTEQQLRCWIGYLASLHDIGKIEETFQCRWPEMRQHLEQLGAVQGYVSKGSVRHEKTTQVCLTETVWPKTKDSKRQTKFFAGVLGAHHQGKNGDKGRLDLDIWNELQRELELEMRKQFISSTEISLPSVEKSDQGSIGALFLGLMILADWIASSESFSQAEDWFSTTPNPSAIEAHVLRFLHLSGLTHQNISFGNSFPEVWPNIPKDGMRGLQQETEHLFDQTDEAISLVLLEAPMGEGKTEAGVYAALQMARQWGKNGFYVGLPTAATSNQMVSRMRGLLDLHEVSDSVRLLHSMAWLVDDNDFAQPRFDTEEANYAAGWLLPVRKGLLAPYAVGTVDQAMMSVLMIKYGVLRLLGLSGKALIIDELHAYDVYMSEILKRLLEWCKALEIPVVLLSATLPPEKKAEMLAVYTDEPPEPAYPAVTAVTKSGKLIVRPVLKTEKHQTVQISMKHFLHQPEIIAKHAIDHVETGGCLCILLNTVKQAQQTYSALKDLDFDGTLLLFHARFPAGQRDEIERTCIRLFGKDKTHRPSKAILVATQVVEQSLDVDFDYMMTAVAPMDLLLQRSGRMHRHEDTLRPKELLQPTLEVLIPKVPGEYGADGFVYPECLLQQTIHLLSQRTEIKIPEDLPTLVADGYDSSAAPADALEQWMEHLLDEQVKASASSVYMINPPEKGFSPIKTPEALQFDDLESSSFLSAKTRLGEPTTRIILLEQSVFQRFSARAKKENGSLILERMTKEEAKALLKESVSVRSKLLHSKETDSEILYGRNLLEGIVIYPAQTDSKGRRYYQAKNGSFIIFDDELGVLFEEGDEHERNF